jgi:hypothetical protein
MPDRLLEELEVLDDPLIPLRQLGGPITTLLFVQPGVGVTE